MIVDSNGTKRSCKLVANRDAQTTVFASIFILIHLIKQYLHYYCVPVFYFGILLIRTMSLYEYYKTLNTLSRYKIIGYQNLNIYLQKDGNDYLRTPFLSTKIYTKGNHLQETGCISKFKAIKHSACLKIENGLLIKFNEYSGMF